MRGDQREENFQKTSLKGQKNKIAAFRPPSFLIFQTCFQYSLTVLLFLPHVCFLLTSNGLGILRDVPVMGCNSVIEKNLKKKLVSAIFGPQFNWLQLLPPPFLLSFLPSCFFPKPITEDLLFLPHNFFGRYLLRIRIKIKRTLCNTILNFSYCLTTSSNGRRNLFCPTYGSEIFLEAEVLYTCFFFCFLFLHSGYSRQAWVLSLHFATIFVFFSIE